MQGKTIKLNCIKSYRNFKMPRLNLALTLARRCGISEFRAQTRSNRGGVEECPL